MDNNVRNNADTNTSEWPIPEALFINLHTMQLESLRPDEAISNDYVLVSDLLVD